MEFIEITGSGIDDFLSAIGFAPVEGSVQSRMEWGHALAEKALRDSIPAVMDEGQMFPRFIIREHEDVHCLIAAMEHAYENSVKNVSQRINRYALTGSQENREAVEEGAEMLARTVGIRFLLGQLHDGMKVREEQDERNARRRAQEEQDMLANEKANEAFADLALRNSEETPGYEGPVNRD